MPLVWVAPSWHDVLFGILIGVASTAGQWIVVLAFRYADASVLAPFSYTQLLWVSILGFLVFGEVPDIWTMTGAAFIVAQRALHRPSRARAAVAVAGAAGRAVAQRLSRALPISGTQRVAIRPWQTLHQRQNSHRQRDGVFHLAQCKARLIEAMPSSRVSLFFRKAS